MSNNGSQAGTAPMWIPDQDAALCFSCGTRFGFFVRRHHCRLCGRVFCDACSNQRGQIPSLIQSSAMASPPGWFFQNPDTHKRMCGPCFERCQNVCSDRDRIDVMLLVIPWGLSMRDIQNLGCVSTAWSRTSQVCLNEWRSTRHLLPLGARVSPLQTRLLHAMAQQLWDHIPWLPLVDTDVRTDVRADVRTDVRANARDTVGSCRELGCGIRCDRAPAATRGVVDLILGCNRRRAIRRILDDSEGVHMFLNVLAAETTRRDQYLVADLLIPLVERQLLEPRQAHRLYFHLWSRDETVANLFLSRLPADLRTTIARSKRLIGCLRAVAVAPSASVRREVANQLPPNCCLPGDPDTIVLRVLHDNVIQRQSHSRPTTIPCLCRRRGSPSFVQCFLMKPESMFADTCVLEFQELLHHIVGGPVQTYDVVPLSGAGLVTIVPGARTLYSLWRDQTTLQNFVMEHNGHESVESVRNRFLESCALATCSSMLVGLGDRHLENIMMTRSGLLFHIDFAHVLGSEPNSIKYLTGNQMRITPQMVDFLGGHQSRYYARFRERCAAVYEDARRWASVLVTILSALQLDEIATPSQLREHVAEVFRPGSTAADAHISITERVDRESRPRFVNQITDVFHHVFNFSS